MTIKGERQYKSDCRTITIKVIGRCKVGGNPHHIWEKHEQFFGTCYQVIPVGTEPCEYFWQSSVDTAKRKRREAIKNAWGPCVCGGQHYEGQYP